MERDNFKQKLYEIENKAKVILILKRNLKIVEVI